MLGRRCASILLLATVALSFLAGCAARGPSQLESNPPQSDALIVASYNIHVGVGMDKKLALDRIADVLTGQNVDVAGLQEVDRFVRRTGGIDELEELKRLTGMNGVFGKSIDFQGGDYGLAILTTGEILETRHLLHPEGRESERRSVLLARIRFREGPVAWFATTHLGLDAADRHEQAMNLLEVTGDLAPPVFLVGDFNARPDPAEDTVYTVMSGAFTDAWSAANHRSFVPLDTIPYDVPSDFDGFTFRSDDPARRIDYIWLKPPDDWVIRRCWVGGTLASDHLPLFTEVGPR